MLKLVATEHSTGLRQPLSNRVAIVTGSTSGIGLGIARALAAQGAAIMLNGLGNPDEIARTRDTLAEETGTSVEYDGADIAQPDQVAGMIARTAHAFGSVDILVNNAGVQHVAPIDAFPVERWDSVLAINLSGAFHAIRAAIPGMKANGWGRIVNVASAHGLVGSPYKSAYVAAKHGILGVTKVAALELAESGITANAVCPGYVWTPLVEQQIDDQARSHGIPREQVIREVLLKKQPSRRFVTVDEIGAVVAFLCSPGAASITGAAIPVDGGWTAE
ncbi:3-hydroxybutyrate dehydrogenase [Limibaculum sp. M0105]|uniref:3-hydroxybutyrate dehydrogenase n=1 Tax=Thermohalobaculum xanthum TaxID=2753746 RepID=A0A8J7M726_9RHOB|nr:3-hydroxybutyrate dehydrogenase [Thermohalobaculum xanthum]MBK0399488.1 3-hydroxybutyrate dehydrogenase [Thermohalobaculum xanthum]